MYVVLQRQYISFLLLALLLSIEFLLLFFSLLNVSIQFLLVILFFLNIFKLSFWFIYVCFLSFLIGSLCGVMLFFLCLIVFFSYMPLQWPQALCAWVVCPSVLFLWTRYLANITAEMFTGVKDEIVRFLWSKVILAPQNTSCIINVHENSYISD